MDPKQNTLAELFENLIVYVVPLYQRLYVWNEEDQWSPLWDDVTKIADEMFNDAHERGKSHANADMSKTHFFGAVVLKVNGFTPMNARKWRVIDGQQRLTTVQLLMTAVADELEHRKIVTQAQRLRQLTINPQYNSPDEEFKITHSGNNYERFRDVMSAKGDEETIGSLGGPMAGCYLYFRNAIRVWINERLCDINLAAHALTTALIVKLQVVAIYLEHNEMEHMIFETLNARGEPLTEWDKIKNYLLYKADEEPNPDQDSFFVTYLEPFDDSWWRDLVGRGTARRPRTDVFADYWLESRLKLAVNTRRVFRVFQEHVDNIDEELKSLAQRLLEDAKYYQKFEYWNSLEQSHESRFHTRRSQMGIGAVWPLLLQLQRIDVDQIERECWFATLESYFVRRLIVGRQARAYDRLALDLLHALPEGECTGSQISRILIGSLAKFTEASTVWPSDADVKWAVVNRQLPYYAQSIVLHEIERYLIPNRAANQNVIQDVQIEHLMPIGWRTEKWPLIETENTEDASELRDKVIQTLGNLTLVNSGLNSSMGNRSWTHKLGAIRKSDNLFLNKHLYDKFPTVWNEDKIRERGKWMGDIICQIWPHSDSLKRKFGID